MLTIIAFPWWLEWNHTGTPIIAVIAIYIAWEQFRINQRHYRLALFDKRMAVFNLTMNMIASVNASANPSLQEIMKFLRDTRDHELLFGPEVGVFVNDLFQKANKLRIYLLTNYSGTAEQQGEIMDWFEKQYGEARNIFLKYLDFRAP